ncbi:MAG TPA: hypothetical protein VIY49_37040 [Bryobacteraceae bacterium]
MGIEKLEPGTRLRIAKALALSMTGHKREGLQLLDAAGVSSHARPFLLMAQAHILSLDGDNAEALEVFAHGIDQFAERAPLDEKATIDGNKNEIRLATLDFSAVAEHYKMQDLLTAAGHANRSGSKLAQADDAARRDEHYEALPLYWNGLVDAYEGGSWLQLRTAHERMARECCALGWLPEAAYHAVVSASEAAARALGEQVLHSVSGGAVSETIECILGCAHLLQHRYVATVIIEILRDVVPDAMVGRVVDWAIEGAGRMPGTRDIGQKIAASWRVLAALMYRCTGEQADRVVAIALKHPLLNTFNTHRRDLIRLAISAFPRLSANTREMLVPVCIALLGPHRHDVDYDDALELAEMIARRSSAESRTRLADALLPRETPISNLKLARLVPLLERQPSPEQLGRLVQVVCRRLRKQVQRIAVGQEVDLDGSYVAVADKRSPQARVTVLIYGAMIELDAAIALRKWLTADQIRALTEAVLDVLDDPANLPSNKVSLIEALLFLSSVSDESTCQFAVSRLEPHASGVAHSDPDECPGAQLSRFRIETNSPSDVAGSALFCMASIAGEHPNAAFLEKVTALVESALEHGDSAVRGAGAAAAGRVPSLSGPLLTKLISCVRDSNPQVACHAALSVSRRADVVLDPSQWDFLAAAVRAGLARGPVDLRRACALCVQLLRDLQTSEGQHRTVNDLLDVVRSDIYYSVRQALGDGRRDTGRDDGDAGNSIP